MNIKSLLIAGLLLLSPVAQAQTDGSGVGIAILDQAIYQPQPELIGKTWYPQPIYTTKRWTLSKTDNPHGTIVANIAGGRGVGVAQGSPLVGVNVFGSGGYDSGAKAFNYIKSWNRLSSGLNVHVANLSYWLLNSSNPFTYNELNVLDNYKDDFVIVKIAGNGGFNAMNIPYNGDPSVGLSHLLIVGSVNSSNVSSSFSNRPGDLGWVKYSYVVAPGERLSVRTPTGTSVVSGTSYSAPYVSGVAAIVMSEAKKKGISLTPSQVVDIIERGAIDLGPPGVDGVYGWGKVDLTRSLALIK